MIVTLISSFTKKNLVCVLAFVPLIYILRNYVVICILGIMYHVTKTRCNLTSTKDIGPNFEMSTSMSPSGDLALNDSDMIYSEEDEDGTSVVEQHASMANTEKIDNLQLELAQTFFEYFDRSEMERRAHKRNIHWISEAPIFRYPFEVDTRKDISAVLVDDTSSMDITYVTKSHYA